MCIENCDMFHILISTFVLLNWCWVKSFYLWVFSNWNINNLFIKVECLTGKLQRRIPTKCIMKGKFCNWSTFHAVLLPPMRSCRTSTSSEFYAKYLDTSAFISILISTETLFGLVNLKNVCKVSGIYPSIYLLFFFFTCSLYLSFIYPSSSCACSELFNNFFP